MPMYALGRFNSNRKSLPFFALVCALLFFLASVPLRADEPYARSRDYDLQHSKIALRFDIAHKKVIGEVTHSVSILHDGVSQIAFDSVQLNIESVTVNKSRATFQTTADKLIVALPASARAGEKFDIAIHYEGKPAKGLYFILPDKDTPDRPKQIWTQGESQDTHYYLPTYDYPNDRLTTETILTVPSSWITVANGKLISVTDAGHDLKTWTWKESLPSSTYLITVVAGEFDELKDSWRGIPVTYYAPKGRGDRLAINYGRTPAMLELFSKKLGVDYPWEKYAQAMVDDFVAGGMENSSATTNTSISLKNPKLVPEYPTDEDDLISHELAHQWFGDLVTCKDWGDLWLNEGFATFFEKVWNENHYPREESDYDRWLAGRNWFANSGLFTKSIVRFDFNDSSEFDQNSYDKGGWVLDMLRHQLGEDNFFRGLKHYLEVNRGKNVVTADLVKALEESSNVDLDQFFNQWVYGAGAPKFDIAYAYDDAKHQVALTVKQTQKVEGRVGIFRIPTDVEITNVSGQHLYTFIVSKESETFTFPSETAPLMVLFDKGDHVLKSVQFHKERKELLYQLKNASELSDRADAALALARSKGTDHASPGDSDDEIANALGNALDADKTWGVRDVAADALGLYGGPVALKRLLAGLDSNEQPWVRNRIVAALGDFKNDANVAAKLESLARDDRSYRVRANAIQALGVLKSANAYGILSAAVEGDSPDDFLRNVALAALGTLGDDRAVPVLRAWAASGKPLESRGGAIVSLGRLQKNDKEITRLIASHLPDTHFELRTAAIHALGVRGDASVIPDLESLLKADDLSIELAPMIKETIAQLQKPSGEKGGGQGGSGDEGANAKKESSEENNRAVLQRLDRLERLAEEMNERLKEMDARLSPK